MKILHLYDDLLDLYGDSGNPRAIALRLESAGIDVDYERKSCGDDIDFIQYDFIYVSPGLPANLAVAAADLAAHKGAICRAIDAGKVFFVVGNAQALFTEGYVTTEGETVPGLGLFEEKMLDLGTITIADVVASERGSGEKLCGFLNSTVKVEARHDEYLFDILSPDTMKRDGLRRNNFFATSLLGPLLIRNPRFADMLAGLAAGRSEPLRLPDDKLETEAHIRVMHEICR